MFILLNPSLCQDLPNPGCRNLRQNPTATEIMKLNYSGAIGTSSTSYVVLVLVRLERSGVPDGRARVSDLTAGWAVRDTWRCKGP